MYSVTSRINAIQKNNKLKQPIGGYLPLKLFQYEEFLNKKELFSQSDENISPRLIGLVVDYLVRYIHDGDAKAAFSISLQGARDKDKFENEDKITNNKSFLKKLFNSKNKISNIEIANSFVNKIIGTDDDSIINACKLVQYDVWFRVGYYENWKLKEDVNSQTIKNIRTMVVNSLNFFESEGSIIKHTLSFRDVNSNLPMTGGYSRVVSCGDADFLTPNGLWDLKVSVNKPSSKDTLQILMYWIMGLHSKQPCYKNISKIGFFNPRLNCAWYINTKDIDPKLIKFVEDEIICYEKQ